MCHGFGMTDSTCSLSADDWFQHLFHSKAARDGGVVRRKIRDMERFVGRDLFCAEIARRGYTAIENGDQVIIFCNAQPFAVLVSGAQTLKQSLPSNPPRGFARVTEHLFGRR